MTHTTDTATVEAETSGTVKVRLLQDCPYGQVNDVVFIESVLVPGYSKARMVDADPAAVAYAESLKNKE
jgi:hypothetical protein